MSKTTAAQRMKKYRENMSEEKKRVMKIKNKVQQKKCRERWTEKKIHEIKSYDKIRQKKRYADSKIKKTLTKFSPQALGKATRKICHVLPRCPIKKIEVLKKLVAKFSVPVDTTKVKRKVQLAPTDVIKIKEFYLSDTVSYQMPGRKDCVRVVENGEKISLQKKILTMTVMEAFQLFVRENPTIKVGKSIFASLRPENVVPVSGKDQTVCCCIYHENWNLLLEGIQKVHNQFPSGSEILDMATCSDASDECKLGTCDKCSDVTSVVNELFQSIEDKRVNYFHWMQTNKKKEISHTMQEVKNLFANQVEIMRKHTFVAKHQLTEVKHLKANLTSNEVVLQVDFAENFNVQQQNEIMSAYWDTQSISIYTAVLSSSTDTQSFVVVSDEMHHDKYSVLAFNRAIFKHAAEQKKVFENVHMFSDGAGGQFKNKYTLGAVVQPKLMNENISSLDWSFFATSHGKGPVDGIGATVKRAVWRRIMQRKVVINTAQEFAHVASESCPNISVLYVDSHEVSEVKNEVEGIWATNEAIPKIRGNHYFCGSSDGIILSSPISAFNHSFQISETTESASVIQSDEAIPFCETPEDEGISADVLAESRQTEKIQKEQTVNQMNTFSNKIAQRNFVLSGNTPMDGNCFFWAVADYLNEHRSMSVSQEDLRQKVVLSLESMTEEEKEETSDFLAEDTFSSYVKKMSKNGTYADHVAIKTLSVAMELTIIIVSEDDTITIGDYATPCHIGYLPSLNHYVTIQRKISVAIGSYYAVDYIDKFFVGVVLEKAAIHNCWKMKFLKQDMLNGKPYFCWPMVSIISFTYAYIYFTYIMFE